MSLYKFLHAADLHLGHSNFGNEGRIKDFADQLDKIHDIAIAQKAQMAILAGDVFDSPDPDPYSVTAFRLFAEKMFKAGISLVAVTGNHDRHATRIGDDPVTRVESVHSHINYSIGGSGKLALFEAGMGAAHALRIAALDWMPSSKVSAALEALPENLDVLVMHQSCSGFLPGIAACEVQLEWLADRARYVAMGDLHISRELRPGDNTVVAYPGSTERCSLGEPADKTVNIVTLDLSDRTAPPLIEKVALPTRPIIELTVDSPEDLEELRAWKPASPDIMVIYKYAPEFEREVKIISSAQAAAGHVAMGIEQSLPKVVVTETFAANQQLAGAEMNELLVARFNDAPLLAGAATDLWNNPENATAILDSLENQLCLAHP